MLPHLPWKCNYYVFISLMLLPFTQFWLHFIMLFMILAWWWCMIMDMTINICLQEILTFMIGEYLREKIIKFYKLNRKNVNVLKVNFTDINDNYLDKDLFMYRTHYKYSISIIVLLNLNKYVRHKCLPFNDTISRQETCKCLLANTKLCKFLWLCISVHNS